MDTIKIKANLKPRLDENSSLPSLGGSNSEEHWNLIYANEVKSYITIGQLENQTRGNNSTVEGVNNSANGEISHVEGYNNQAVGYYSHVEGSSSLTTENGIAAHAEGYGTIASGLAAHAEGYGQNENGTESGYTVASGQGSHAEGVATKANGEGSHAEGIKTTVNGIASHVEGFITEAEGDYSHAEGQETTSKNIATHAEGLRTEASGGASHAEGHQTIARGGYSHAEGLFTHANGTQSHAEGCNTYTTGDSSHAEGHYTRAIGENSHAEGYYTEAQEDSSHAEGYYSVASGIASHAESGYGFRTIQDISQVGQYLKVDFATFSNNSRKFITIRFSSSSESSIPEMLRNTNNYIKFIKEDNTIESDIFKIYTIPVNENQTDQSGSYSYTFQIVKIDRTEISENELSKIQTGYLMQVLVPNTSSGKSSHVSGACNIASGDYSYADGIANTSSGLLSHSYGRECQSKNTLTYAFGDGTIANKAYNFVFGRYNVEDNSSKGFLEIVGNGTWPNARSNARLLDKNGKEWLAGGLTIGPRNGKKYDNLAGSEWLTFENGYTGNPERQGKDFDIGCSLWAIHSTQDADDDSNATTSSLWFDFSRKRKNDADTAANYAYHKMWLDNQGTLRVAKNYISNAGNDYAEYRKSRNNEKIEAGRVVIENGDGTLSLCSKRLERGCEIVSDTYGTILYEMEGNNLPIAIAGRVLAYPDKDKNSFLIGHPVCSGENGTVSMMSEEEERLYPSRIIGVVSEIPDYDYWDNGNEKIAVKDRIWIRIK